MEEHVMNDTFTLDVDQARELKHAFKRNGWTNEDIKNLTKGDVLRAHLGSLRGTHQISEIEGAIDLSRAALHLPRNGWKVKHHRGTGIAIIERRGEDLFLDGKRIAPFLTDEQKEGVIGGVKLRPILKDQPALNANVFEYLLGHQELIPKRWRDYIGKTENPCFWGTIFQDPQGDLYIPWLCWDNGLWTRRFRPLDSNFGAHLPALILAN